MQPNPFNHKLNRKNSDSHVTNLLKISLATKIVRQQRKKRQELQNRSIQGKAAQIAMSLDFTRNKDQTKALLLNQPSLDDSIAFNIHESKDGKKTFFTSENASRETKIVSTPK